MHSRQPDECVYQPAEIPQSLLDLVPFVAVNLIHLACFFCNLCSRQTCHSFNDLPFSPFRYFGPFIDGFESLHSVKPDRYEIISRMYALQLRLAPTSGCPAIFYRVARKINPQFYTFGKDSKKWGFFYGPLSGGLFTGRLDFFSFFTVRIKFNYLKYEFENAGNSSSPIK